jgi:hypothetical protein
MLRPKQTSLFYGLPTAIVSEICSFGDLLDYMAFSGTCRFALSVAHLVASSPRAVSLSRDAFPPVDSAFWRYVRPRHLACTLQPTLPVDEQLESLCALQHSLRSLHIELSRSRLQTGLDLTFAGAFSHLESLRAPDAWCDIRSVSPSLTALDIGRCSASSAHLIIETVGARLRSLQIDDLISSADEMWAENEIDETVVWHAILERCTAITHLDINWTVATNIYEIVKAMPRIRSLGAIYRLQSTLAFECLTLEECCVTGNSNHIHQLLRGAPNLRRLEWRGDDGVNAEDMDDTLPSGLLHRSSCAPLHHTKLVSLLFSGFRFVPGSVHCEWAHVLLPRTLTVAALVVMPSLVELVFEWCTIHSKLQFPGSVRILAFNSCQFGEPAHIPYHTWQSDPMFLYPMPKLYDCRWLRSPNVISLSIGSKLIERPCLLSKLSERFPALSELYLKVDDSDPTSIAPEIVIPSLITLPRLHTLGFTLHNSPPILPPPDYYAKLISGLPTLRRLQLSTPPRHSYYRRRNPECTKAWDAAQRRVQTILDQRTRTRTETKP